MIETRGRQHGHAARVVTPESPDGSSRQEPPMRNPQRIEHADPAAPSRLGAIEVFTCVILLQFALRFALWFELWFAVRLAPPGSLSMATSA